MNPHPAADIMERLFQFFDDVVIEWITYRNLNTNQRRVYYNWYDCNTIELRDIVFNNRYIFLNGCDYYNS